MYSNVAAVSEYFPFYFLPFVVKQEFIRALNPEELLEFSRTCRINYQKCRRIRSFPLQNLTIDFSADANGTISATNFDGQIIQLDIQNLVGKKISIVEKLIIKGIEPATQLTESTTDSINNIIGQILSLIGKTKSLEFVNLLPNQTVTQILESARNAVDYDISQLHLSQPTKAIQLLAPTLQMKTLKISNSGNVEFDKEIFDFLLAKTSLQEIIIQAYFDTKSAIDFVTKKNCGPSRKLEFIVDKMCQWNYFAHLRGELEKIKNKESLPKIGINNMFVQV